MSHKQVQCGKRIALSSVVALGIFASFLIVWNESMAADLKRIGGWAWNPSIGWINHQNAIEDKETKDKKGAFGVERDVTTGVVTGWSWSAKAGWVCWGTTCQTNPALQDEQKYGSKKPDILLADGSVRPTKIEADGMVHGWTKLVSYKQRGWICLSSLTCDPGAAISWGVRYDTFKNEFTGWAWGGSKLGWIVFSGATLADPSYIYKAGPQVGKVACEPNCDKSVDVTDAAKPTRWKTHYLGAWLQALGGTIASIGGLDGGAPPPLGLTPPLSNKNSEFLIISGKNSQDNLGRTISQFESVCTRELGAKACARFGLVKNQNLVKEGALTFPLAKKVEVTINRGDENITRTKLKSKGASLDVDALTTLPPNGKQQNKYGKRVVSLPTTIRGEIDLKNELRASYEDGTVFYVPGNFIVGRDGTAIDSWDVWNGQTANGKPAAGARTIVVRGNITIRRNVLYEKKKTGVTHPRQLASIAWIALKNDDDPQGQRSGNIIIDHCIPPSSSPKLIAEVSGFFFAENTISTGRGLGGTCLSLSAGNYDREIRRLRVIAPDCRAEDLTDEQKRSCTRMSVLSDPNVDIPLVVHGAMVAKRFNFERRYGGMDAPSEQIVNDGRSFLSIPPGLDDFLSAFPSF